MFEDRLARFSRERLDGRDIPEDLRIILIGHWSGDAELLDLIPVEFLEPGTPHPLRDHGYLREDERADPEMQAIMAASDRMSEYVQLVAEGGKGWLGYWFHPAQPAGEPPPLIELDTEARFWSMDGANFAEACIADTAHYEDDPQPRYAALAERLIAKGVPINTKVYSELDGPGFRVDPNELDERLADEERRERGL